MTTVSRLAAQLNLKACGSGDPEITGVTEDSRLAGPGVLFAAVKGLKFNGRDYAAEAARRGAAAVLLEGEDLDLSIPRLIAPAGRIRPVMAAASAIVYGRPWEKMITVGITGTNGKTTTAYLAEAVLAEAGLIPGVMGTINFRWPGHLKAAPNTTPEGPVLCASLADMLAAGAKSAILEVSSHALSLGRVTGLGFEAALFTNLSRDHLDFHPDMEDYYQAKKLLFTKFLRPGDKKAVVNIDDQAGARLAAELGSAALTFGFSPEAEVRGSDLHMSRQGLSFTIAYEGASWVQTSPLLARVNGYNLLGAAALTLAMHIHPAVIQKALAAAKGAPGRLERVGGNDDYLTLVDYAHAPDALEKALEGSRALGPKRLITVFGCGGDRDKGKRPIMGRLAGELSDLAVITSDNPRTEDAGAIMNDIEAGLAGLGFMKKAAGAADAFEGKSYLMIEDRRAAIYEAVRLLEPGDILLIAGKGHENYQIIGRDKITLDDRAEALDALKEMGRA